MFRPAYLTHVRPDRPSRGPVQTLLRWSALYRQRWALAHLDADRLSDLGIEPEKAARESARPFWDAPDTWRR